jgi:hypothetical protein
MKTKKHGQEKLQVRFEALKAIKMPMVVFWVLTPYERIGGYQRLVGTYWLHFQG